MVLVMHRPFALAVCVTKLADEVGSQKFTSVTSYSSAVAEDSDCTKLVHQATSKPDSELARF